MIAKFDKTKKSAEVRLWLPIDEIEPQAQHQIHETAKLPWVHSIAIMPDAHMGVGATVGSVVATRGAISPSCVGVDLSCGMAAVETNLHLDDLESVGLANLRSQIEEKVPVGFNSHKIPVIKNDPLFDRFKDLTSKVQNQLDKALNQVGTLGGGNHFIEICLDSGRHCTCKDFHHSVMMFNMTIPRILEPKLDCKRCNGTGISPPKVWIMLHSGSRGIGNQLASYHIEVAKKLAHNQDLPDPDLAAFLIGTPEMQAYRHDLYWAQDYAALNRAAMLNLVKKVMVKNFPEVEFGNPIQCNHNYVSEESHFGEDLYVTRKGAINASSGKYGIIPGSMGDRSFIVKGLGNPDSFNSASHGAGRKMSRTQAKKKFSLQEFREQTAGVECRKDAGVLDEIPGAYKSIDQVMKNQSDLVEIVHELKQVMCIKG